MDKKIEKLCRKFGIEGEYLRYELVTNGHINTTYKVYFFRDEEEKDYILQRLNTYVFKNPIEVMNNISSVTEYIRAKIKAGGISAKRYVLHYYKSVDDGNYYIVGDQGGFWRLCRYIDNSISFNETDNLKVLEEAGRAFGNFQLFSDKVDGHRVARRKQNRLNYIRQFLQFLHPHFYLHFS